MKYFIMFMLSLCCYQGSLAAVLNVEAGTSIQAAIEKANEGDTILIHAGTYYEALHIDKNRITLQGSLEGGKWPIIDGRDELNDGLIISANNADIQYLHIRNFKGNGISTQGSNSSSISHVLVEATGIYGIYTSLGRNIKIEDSLTWGIKDAGIYVGMCERVDVRRNYAFENVAGIEIENSSHVLVESNYLNDNTGGILAFALPGLVTKKNDDVVIRNNWVVGNNRRNFSELGSVVANLPPGVGILNLASDNVIIENNTIKDHASAGIIVADLNVVSSLTPDPAVDPNPDNNKILANLFINNGHRSFTDYFNWYHYIIRNIWYGGNPQGTVDDILPPAADLVSTKNGSGNCVVNLAAITTVNAEQFTECISIDPSTQKITTMIDPMAADGIRFNSVGEEVFAVVCAGCHATNIARVGPPLTEIGKKYRGNPAGIAAFAKAPKKVRSNFPEMPSQSHLGDDKLQAVAEYILTNLVP